MRRALPMAFALVGACQGPATPVPLEPGDPDLDFALTPIPDPPAPQEPLEPARVIMACPAGWRAIHEDDYSVCSPWPTDSAEACPNGEIHLPGRPGRTPTISVS